MTVPLTPVDLREFIQRAGIQAELMHEIGDTPTVSAAAESLGVTPDRIVKTLLFLVRTPGTDLPPLPVVVISNGETRVDKRALAAHFQVGKKQVKLAPPDVVLAELGYPAGGVPPFGHRHSHPVLLDRSVAGFEASSMVYAGGGDDRTMLAVTVSELMRVVPGIAVLDLGG